MKRIAALILLLAGSAAYGADATQPAATSPATAPAPAPTTVSAAPSSAPATMAASQPATMPGAVATEPVIAASTAPSTEPSTAPSTMAATGPSTSPSTMAATEPSTAPSTMASTNPSTNPSTSPTTLAVSGTGSRRREFLASLPAHPVDAARSMSADFAILNRRSIFVKGQQRVSDPVARAVLPPSTAVATTQDSSSPASPEHRIVFNGATRANDQMAAFLEDTSSNSIMKLKVGDSVAFGKITGITLDVLTYEARGKVTEVTIGHNLEGGVVALASTSQPAPVSVSGAPTTGPTSAPSASGSAEPNDILERLRRKRAQELGQ